MIGWSSPLVGLVKLNFDGSSLGNLGQIGIGGVIRDHSGRDFGIVGGFVAGKSFRPLHPNYRGRFYYYYILGHYFLFFIFFLIRKFLLPLGLEPRTSPSLYHLS